ncbi:hypothetical protein SCH4B_4000 [Ruegeria sp. TrichCH4B]|nr:hypothetical protein SCH4B_4000 [Ruegeria sp. TrichCH4B]
MKARTTQVAAAKANVTTAGRNDVIFPGWMPGRCWLDRRNRVTL